MLTLGSGWSVALPSKRSGTYKYYVVVPWNCTSNEITSCYYTHVIIRNQLYCTRNREHHLIKEYLGWMISMKKHLENIVRNYQKMTSVVLKGIKTVLVENGCQIVVRWVWLSVKFSSLFAPPTEICEPDVKRFWIFSGVWIIGSYLK